MLSGSWKRWEICQIKYNVLLRGKILRDSQTIFWWSVENWSVYLFIHVLASKPSSVQLWVDFFFLREFRAMCRKLQTWGLLMWSPFPAPLSYPVEVFHCFVNHSTTHSPLQPSHLHVKGSVAENPLRENHKCFRRNELMIPWEIQGWKKLLGFRKLLPKWNRKRIGSYFDH